MIELWYENSRNPPGQQARMTSSTMAMFVDNQNVYPALDLNSWNVIGFENLPTCFARMSRHPGCCDDCMQWNDVVRQGIRGG